MHKLPADLRQALTSTPAALAVWEDITSLARNEWICWVTSGKKAETRNIRIEKTLSKLKGGLRQPCCWTGCMHRIKVWDRVREWFLDFENPQDAQDVPRAILLGKGVWHVFHFTPRCCQAHDTLRLIDFLLHLWYYGK